MTIPRPGAKKPSSPAAASPGVLVLNLNFSVDKTVLIPAFEKNSVYRLARTISLPGGTPQQFKNLACDPAWKEARWFGFSSFSAGHASYYLDDLVMENR